MSATFVHKGLAVATKPNQVKLNVQLLMVIRELCFVCNDGAMMMTRTAGSD